MIKIKKYIDYLSKWIEKELLNSKLSGVLIGISGGIDSALVAAICHRNLNLKVNYLYIDIDNSKLDSECVKALEKYLKQKIIKINLKKSFNLLCKELNCQDKIAKGNIKARLRMLTLYNYAYRHNLMVLGTTNADEYYLGYFTKYGDGVCDLHTIVKMTKTEIYHAARILNLPEIIIKRQPTASLYEKQTDESDIGCSYEEIDQFLLSGELTDVCKKEILIKRHKQNLHKLKNIPKPKILSKIKY